MYTRSRAREVNEDLAVVLISTHGGIGLRYTDEENTLMCPISDVTKFIDTFEIPRTRDGLDVNIFKFSATSPGICNVVDESYTNLLTDFIKSRTRNIINPDTFVEELRHFYRPLHEDVIRLDISEREAELNKEERRLKRLRGEQTITPFERKILGYSSRNLNYEKFKSGQIIANKLFCRTDKELEGVKEASSDFTIKVLNMNDDDIFDELVFDVSETPSADGTDRVSSAMMSRLIEYLVFELNKKNIIIIDLTCSSFDISSRDIEKISGRTQRRVAREIRTTGLFGGKLIKRKSTKRVNTSRKRKTGRKSIKNRKTRKHRKSMKLK